MKLSEIYQEYGMSTFTSGGNEYDLNKLFQLMDNKPVRLFDVSDLDWVLDFDTPNKDRMRDADTSIPVLIAKYDGRLVVVDGLHRLAKAKLNHMTQIKGKFVDDATLDSVKM